MGRPGLASPGGPAAPPSPSLAPKRAASTDLDAANHSVGARSQRTLTSKQDQSIMLTNLFQDLVDVTAPLAPKTASFDAAEDKLAKQMFDIPLIASMNFGDPTANVPVVVEQCVKWLMDEGTLSHLEPTIFSVLFFAR